MLKIALLCVCVRVEHGMVNFAGTAYRDVVHIVCAVCTETLHVRDSVGYSVGYSVVCK